MSGLSTTRGKLFTFEKALAAITSERRAHAELWCTEWSTDPRSDDFHYPLSIDERGYLVWAYRNRSQSPYLSVRDILGGKIWEVRCVEPK